MPRKAKSEGLIWAEFETPNFTFSALGSTQGECWGLLSRAWNKHAKESGAEPNYFIVNQEDVQYVEVKPGCVLRDRQPFGL